MKKMIALSTAAAMLLSMSTAALADIETGMVKEEKTQWPANFDFGETLVVFRDEETREYQKEDYDSLELIPGDEIYLPLYFTTKEGETVVIGASQEAMTGRVPYTGNMDKSWRVNLLDKSKNMVETAELYKAKSSDKQLLKGGVYVKIETADRYNSLEELNFQMEVMISERHSQNKTPSVKLEGVFGNPKAEREIDLEWENPVFGKAVWEVPEEQDGTAVFNFGEDAYFTVKMFGGDKVMFDFDTSFNKDIAARYDEDLYFYNFRGDLDQFSARGTLTIPTTGPMYLYEMKDGVLRETDAVYNAENETVELRTRSLGNYVLSPVALDAEMMEEISEEAAEEVAEELSGEGRIIQTKDYYSNGSNSDKGNPDTGAEDFTGVMAALAVLSLAAGGMLYKKK